MNRVHNQPLFQAKRRSVSHPHGATYRQQPQTNDVLRVGIRHAGPTTVSEQADRLKERTMQFALDVCELIKLIASVEPGPTVKRQIAKSATSVAANYRAACRARSHAEFTARIGLVAEEADETLF